MIPRIIHYTWFSGDPFPEKIQACIDSWKRLLPGYEFRLWDMDAIRDIDSMFLHEAITARKWAYAADFVRLYAISHHGGIYLDTDVMLYHDFDAFLQHRAFIGKENSLHFTGSMSSQYLTSHCFGAEAGHPFVERCLAYFNDRHFVTSTNEALPIPLRYNFVLLPYIQAEIARQYGYDWKPLTQTIQHCDEGLVIYPTEYFDCSKQTPNSVCRHLALGGWRTDQPNEPTYNLRYKLTWRFLQPFKKLLGKFNYVCMKVE